MKPDSQTGYRLHEIVARFGGELIGDGDVLIRRIASLSQAQADHLSFLSNSKYRSQLQSTSAGAVIVGQADRDATALPRIVSDNPYAYFARVLALFNPVPLPQSGVHASALVDATAVVPASAAVGAFAVLGKNVSLGENVVIGAGCYIGDGVSIGDDSLLYPHVAVYHDCSIGKRAIVHAGVVIGSDGFGLAPEDGRWLKIPQVGRVVIGDDVEIGANTTIDRGALDDTVIEDGVKLDNLIQVAHNVRIGAHSAMAACVGIAGSARIGRHCTVGGASVILGHLEIADHVNISAGTLITKSISKAGTYTSAMPFSPHREWLKSAVHLRHLDTLAETVHRLEARINELERNKP